MKKIASIVALSLLITLPIAAQYDPPTAGDDVYEFVSPVFLGGGFSVTSDDSPTGNIMNPAVSGLKQRVVLDASYIGLTGFGDGADNEGWQGHATTIGTTVPSRVGVFSGLVHFLGSELDSMKLGSTFLAHTSFSKALYDDLLVGTGLNFRVGGDGRTDTGVTADLGLLHLVGDAGFIKDFKWGISVLGLGLPYEPVEGKSSVPSVFTPAVGSEFSLIQTDDVELVMRNSFSLPTVQNLKANVGASLNIADRVSVFSSVRGDFRQITDGDFDSRSFVPSVGISVNLSTNFQEDENFISNRGWNQSELRTRVAAAPMYDNVWAFGAGVNAPLGVVDREPPEISVDYEGPTYISPNNDGVKDALEFPITIEDDRFVESYTLEFRNSGGETVRVIENKEDRPENEGFENILQRLAAVESGIPIPETLRWNGTSDEGSVVEDGTYRFVLSAVDDNGNEARSNEYEVVVDTTDPTVELEKPSSDDRIFSPDGDGNKDEFPIAQSGSTEDLWEAQITNSDGEVVKTWSWEDSAPEAISWDGRDDDGDFVPDGVYQYEIESTDRAGNSTEEELTNIILDTRPTPVNISIDTAYFSPNDDGVKDRIRLLPEVPVTSGLERWSIEIVDEDGEVHRRYSGLRNPPERVTFDGDDESGSRLPEGRYRARFSTEYQNGNRPEATSPEFTLDVTPPRATVRANFEAFSPNSDGNRDVITFDQETSSEQLWEGEISRVGGDTVRTFTFRETADLSISWDGRRSDGQLAEDGDYRYQLTATDRAGNTGSSEPVRFTLDTEEAEVLLSPEYEAFSPNADGTRDQLRLFPQVQQNENVVSYTLTIETDDGSAVRTISGEGEIDEPFVWDGFDDDGDRVSDGDYRAVLEVTYNDGDVVEASTSTVALDTTYPRVDLEAEYTLFSPNGDGNKDVVRIEQDSSEEDGWEGRIVDEDGETVRNFFWKGELPTLEWDGRDDSGNLVSNGSYRYEVSATDAAGNTTEETMSNIRVDNRETEVFVTVDRSAFSPNGDDYRDTVTISIYTNLLEGVESWTLDILDETGTPVRTFEGDQAQPNEQIEWNGEDSRGDIEEGEYTARYVVEYAKGDTPRRETSRFRLDVSPPEVDVDLSPVPFSPDNDGVDDELEIAIDVEDESDIASWRMEILDRNENFFTDFSGQGMPAEEIIWDGRSESGELVISAEDYPYELEVTDVVGNTTVTEGEIPVDVLVVRDGDRLRVQISSITFAPNSPELITDSNTERGAKNAAVLTRLVEVFTKYDDYRIRIEGHAVNLTQTEREEEEELQPLSEARAESVKDALVQRGLSEDRISTLGRGGTEPLVPHTDEENRWKNRRVEFILIR
ncbi:MAG: FlgD immunoglobulin-like domain containing protein [Spirochaetota bacterium]